MFNHDVYFAHHEALPEAALFGDEGAANHNRLGGAYDQAGIQVFVYGQQQLGGTVAPKSFRHVKPVKLAKQLHAYMVCMPTGQCLYSKILR